MNSPTVAEEQTEAGKSGIEKVGEIKYEVCRDKSPCVVQLFIAFAGRDSTDVFLVDQSPSTANPRLNYSVACTAGSRAGDRVFELWIRTATVVFVKYNSL